jgi:hypothetical protein
MFIIITIIMFMHNCLGKGNGGCRGSEHDAMKQVCAFRGSSMNNLQGRLSAGLMLLKLVLARWNVMPTATREATSRTSLLLLCIISL